MCGKSAAFGVLQFTGNRQNFLDRFTGYDEDFEIMFLHVTRTRILQYYYRAV